jgi:hypothetical protein
MSQPSAPIIRLCPEHLCELFRQEGLQAKIETNAWREEIRRRRREGSETTFQEFTDYNGNRIVETQELTWIDNATDEERARLHRYITREGKIGASGLPDPKRIHLENGAKSLRRNRRYHVRRNETTTGPRYPRERAGAKRAPAVRFVRHMKSR